MRGRRGWTGPGPARTAPAAAARSPARPSAAGVRRPADWSAAAGRARAGARRDGATAPGRAAPASPGPRRRRAGRAPRRTARGPSGAARANTPCSLCSLTRALSSPSYAPAANGGASPGGVGVGQERWPRRGSDAAQDGHSTRPARPQPTQALPSSRSRPASAREPRTSVMGPGSPRRAPPGDGDRGPLWTTAAVGGRWTGSGRVPRVTDRVAHPAVTSPRRSGCP